MKSNHAAQRLFSRTNFPAAGLALLAARLSFVWASFWVIGEIALRLPGLLEQAQQSPTPFMEILAFMFFSSFWRIILSLCLACIAIGLVTRPAAIVLSAWSIVFTALAAQTMFGVLGQWSFLWFALLGLLLTTSWGRVWGLDDVILRVIRSKNKIFLWLLSADDV